MREIKISIETAQRWVNGTDEELKGLALQTYPELAKKELPKSWEELLIIKGYYVDEYSEINKSKLLDKDDCNINIFATKGQAEASIALAQLSQLREVYRNGWVPDYMDGSTKFVIIFKSNKLIKDTQISYTKFLSFQDAKTRDLFLENFRELIEKAKPLMS